MIEQAIPLPELAYSLEEDLRHPDRLRSGSGITREHDRASDMRERTTHMLLTESDLYRLYDFADGAMLWVLCRLRSKEVLPHLVQT